MSGLSDDRLAQRTWSDVHSALREEGVPEDRAMAHADIVRIELEKRLAERALHPVSDATPDLAAALDAVESQHSRGDYTEEGWVPNPTGLECHRCGMWADCTAQLLVAALRSVSDATPDLAAALETAITKYAEDLCGSGGATRSAVIRTIVRAALAASKPVPGGEEA